jgi:cobyrinic acid a,c-diamide synthase
MSCPRIVIAATGSGVGKTSIAIALARALTRRGRRVQTFKVGPDFLDPTHLALASGRPCYNLDGWMCGQDHVRDLFRRKTADADIALIEGVMGMFDGASPETSEGSTAEIARWLDAPVVLVAGAHGVARSLAATVKGFATLEPDIRIAGVIANHCGSERHAAWLCAALASASLPPLLGAIPRGALPELASRHLGLVTADRARLSPSVLDAFADGLERHMKVEEVVSSVECRASSVGPTTYHLPPTTFPPLATLGVARDAAFHFYYPDNLEALQAQGARLVYFSPLADRALPDGLDAVYLGGGYPEEHAAELSGNTAMLEALRRFVAAGGALYAECGGLIYLSQAIATRDGASHPMAGVLPFRTRMGARRKVLGYVEVTLAADSLLGRRGDVLRGHEFHYSEIVDPALAYDGWQTAYETRYQRDPAPAPGGFRRGRVLAGYAHLHFASRPAAVKAFLESARSGRTDGGARGERRMAGGKGRVSGVECRTDRRSPTTDHHLPLSPRHPTLDTPAAAPSTPAFIHAFLAKPLSGPEIEKRSFEMIDTEAGAHGLPPEQWEIVRRMIHTVGDMALPQSVRFTPDAVQSGVKALRAGAPIFVDSNMIRAGLSMARLRAVNPEYGSARIHCHVADADIAEEAARTRLPRSLLAIRKARAMLDGAIVAIGNAPVALLELNRMILEDALRPALVIGMPVGFVHVVESKQELLALPVPSIVVTGRRGGSTLAVSVIHALCTVAAWGEGSG